MDIEVANVTGMITYRQELDLTELAEVFPEREEITSVTYEPAAHHWLQTRFAPDDTYVAFYRSGRCSITGCKSVDQFENIVNIVNNVMRDLLGFEYQPEAEVSNLVATADLELAIPLEALSLELGLEQTEYEPEGFPGLVYHGSDYVVLVFESGKLLCTGLTEIEAVSEVVETLESRIRLIV